MQVVLQPLGLGVEVELALRALQKFALCSCSLEVPRRLCAASWALPSHMSPRVLKALLANTNIGRNRCRDVANTLRDLKSQLKKRRKGQGSVLRSAEVFNSDHFDL